MADTRSKDQRTRIMKSVGTRDTGPELIVRRRLHRLGYRFRLHAEELPGTPDIVFRRKRKAIFVHGCFWHGHGCAKGRLPKSRVDYWGPKIEANRTRDRRDAEALEAEGWKTLTVWQCETRDEAALDRVLTSFLSELDGGRYV